MKHFLLTILLFVGFATISTAQTGCGSNGRYIRKIFTVNTAPTTVTFGQNTDLGGALKTLKMDIYRPDGDTETNRPVMMVAFGGSFIGGTRTGTDVVPIAKAWAARGYVAVSIDYRIIPLLQALSADSTVFAKEVVSAVSDYKAAVRFLRMTAATGNPYGINPNLIFAGGVSAGSIAAMHAAYLRTVSDAPAFVRTFVVQQGGIHGNTDLAGNSCMAYSDSIMGIYNVCGGLYRRDILDAGEVPIVGIHGTADGTVPYGFGIANVSGRNIISIEGSGSVQPHATSLGVPSTLITVPNGGHVTFMAQTAPGVNETWADSLDHVGARFFYNLFEQQLCVATENEAHTVPTIIAPNPAHGEFNVRLSEVPSSYSLSVSDLLGQTVYTHKSDRSEEVVSCQNFPKGTYLVRIVFEDASVRPITKKVVVE